MEMRGLMGGFYKISEWIMRLAVTNVLWILTSIPVWFLVIMLLNSETIDQFNSILLLIAVLLPFTWFPSTSAMFSVARKWVMGDTDVPLLKTFFRSYRENYRQAMIGGILYAVIFAVLIVDYRAYLQNIAGLGVLAYLFLFMMFLLVVSLFYFFSLLSHFHMKMTQLIKNALLLTIGRPIRSILMLAGSAAVVLLSVKFTFLIPFFMGSIIAAYVYYHFNLIIQKMQLLAEKEAEGAGEDEGASPAEADGETGEDEAQEPQEKRGS